MTLNFTMLNLMTPAVFWICFGVLLFIFEVLTPGFVVACFGIGCFFAAFTQLFALGIVWQLAAFCCGSLLSLLLLRPVVLKHIQLAPPASATNAHALIGQTGMVTTEFDDIMFEGRVKAGGDDWKARSAENIAYGMGTKVVVQSIEGVTLTVQKA